MRTVKEVRDKTNNPVVAALPQGTVGRIASAPTRFRQFLHDVRMEMRNVTWPTKADVQSTTLVVLFATFFFGFYLGVALDFPFAEFMNRLIRLGRTLVQ